MKQIFINIPASDLEKSMQFYLALGFTINPLFTDEDQKCMVWSESIYIMLQSLAFSNSYLNKTTINIKNAQIPSYTLPVESIEQVNQMMERGINAGGKEPVGVFEEDFMYLRNIEDPDGYIWGIMYLDIEIFKTKRSID